jgi:hypothetical protein
MHVNIDAEFEDLDGTISTVVYYAMKFAIYGELFNFIDNTDHFSE